MSKNLEQLLDVCKAALTPMASRPEELGFRQWKDEGSGLVRIEVRPSAYDFPRMMGSGGRNHKSLKFLLTIAASTIGESCSLYIVPSGECPGITRHPFAPNPAAPIKPTLDFLEKVLPLVIRDRFTLAHKSDGHNTWIDIKTSSYGNFEPAIFEQVSDDIKSLCFAQGKSYGRIITLRIGP